MACDLNSEFAFEAKGIKEHFPKRLLPFSPVIVCKFLRLFEFLSSPSFFLVRSIRASEQIALHDKNLLPPPPPPKPRKSGEVESESIFSFPVRIAGKRVERGETIRFY